MKNLKSIKSDISSLKIISSKILNITLTTVCILVLGSLGGCHNNSQPDAGQDTILDAAKTSVSTSSTPVTRKGVTLAGDVGSFIDNNFAKLQDVLDTGAGVIGVNLPWYAATQPCSQCQAERPADPRDWNDPTYTSSQAVQHLDQISNYIRNNGNGAMLMVIAWGTPGWAACPGDDGNDTRFYPPKDAADFGDFMYAMSERYSGNHTSDDGLALGFVRDWVIYNEVNAPDWWMNTACNTQNHDPVYYYGGVLNQAYQAVHHLPSSSDVRVLAGGLTSYHHEDYEGTAGLRISTSYQDWDTQTQAIENDQQNHAWISPLDFVDAMKNYNLQFDAVALHPYSPKIYDNPLLQPPAGAVSLGNISTMLNKLQNLWPDDESKWHLALTEFHLQSYYGDTSLGWDHESTIPCPNFFCAETTEYNLNQFVQDAYGTDGSNKPYVDYLIWTMWDDVEPYTGGIVRGDGTDKTEGIGSGSVRATYSAIN